MMTGTPPPLAARRVLLRGGLVYAGVGLSAATALLSDGATIAWIGDDAGAAAQAATADEIVDLDGRLVTPGFVDAHVHLAMTGFGLASANLGIATNRDEALDLIRASADAADAADRDRGDGLVYAHGWDETTWPDQLPLTVTEVDQAVSGRPAYVARVDSHSAVLSSALARQVDRSLDGWLPGGRVARDAHHAARTVVDSLRTPDERRRALAAALDHAASRGITHVHELNAPHISPWTDAALIEELTSERPSPVVVRYWGAPAATVGEDDRRLLAGYAGDFCIDGAVGSRTAAMRSAYADDAGAGNLYLDAQAVADHVVDCTERGTQAGFHVIGDRACDTMAQGFELAASKLGDDAIRASRHRVEHVEMPDASAVSTLARLGMVASVQPAFDAAWGSAGGLYEQRLGAERAAPMNPFGSMQRAGITLAFGSDSPVTPLDPWGGVRAAAYHHNPPERLTVAEAFTAHTVGGHRAARDDSSGVLAAGAQATYVVWRAGHLIDGLPSLADPSARPECVQTVIGGSTVYHADTDQRREN